MCIIKGIGADPAPELERFRTLRRKLHTRRRIEMSAYSEAMPYL